MKNIIFIFFAINSLSINCQTYISPFYGYGSSYLYPTSTHFGNIYAPIYDPHLYHLIHDGRPDYSDPVYFYENHLFGIKINQNIKYNFELELESSFSATKKIPHYVPSDLTVHAAPFGYNKYCFLFDLKYYRFKYLFFSAGIGVEKIKIIPEYTGYYKYIDEYFDMASTQLNYNLAVGGIYKNFFCEFKFIDGFTNIRGNDLLFYPISSFYAIVGYRLKIYPLRSKKRVDCPEL